MVSHSAEEPGSTVCVRCMRRPCLPRPELPRGPCRSDAAVQQQPPPEKRPDRRSLVARPTRLVTPLSIAPEAERVVVLAEACRHPMISETDDLPRATTPARGAA